MLRIYTNKSTTKMNTPTVNYIFLVFFFNFSIFGMETLPSDMVKYIVGADTTATLSLYPKDYFCDGNKDFKGLPLVNKHMYKLLGLFFIPRKVYIIDHISAEHFLKSGYKSILWHMFTTRNISYEEQFSPKTIIDANITFYDKAFRFEHRFSIILEKDHNPMLHMDYKVLINQKILTSLLHKAPKEEKSDLMYFSNLIKKEVSEGTVELNLDEYILHKLANGLTSKKNNIIFLSQFFKNFAYTRDLNFINLGKLLSEVLIKYNEGISAKAICASLRLKDNIYNEFISVILNDNKDSTDEIKNLANTLKARKDNNNIKEAIKKTTLLFFYLIH